MGLLEFLLVLIPVVLGLGMTEVLEGAAGLLRVRETVRFYWIHTLLDLGVFFALVQQWWESWSLGSVAEIDYFTVVILLGAPVCLFLIAHLINPTDAEDADMRTYYYRQAPLLWGLIVLATVVGTLAHAIALDRPLVELANLTSLPTVLLGIALAFSKKEKLHSVLVPVIFLLLILDTVLAEPVIGVG